MEVGHGHALGKKKQEGGWNDELLERVNSEEQASDQLTFPGFEAPGSDASSDRTFLDGGEFELGAEARSDEEANFLGIPGPLGPEQVTTLLRKRQAAQSAQLKRAVSVSGPR